MRQCKADLALRVWMTGWLNLNGDALCPGDGSAVKMEGLPAPQGWKVCWCIYGVVMAEPVTALRSVLTQSCG